MHPYRDAPVGPALEADEDETRIAFVVLAVVAMIELFAAPLTLAGLFGGACSVASVTWLARHSW